jgi:uncharacterized paraquat-inducible protein A
MFYVILFLFLTVLAVIVLAKLLILWIKRMIAQVRKKAHYSQLMRLKKTVMIFIVIVVLDVGLVTVSQYTAFTPGIIDENGNTQ